jgi:DeoR/GlpR family transcriptional regulator of sugar metabolism
VAANSDSAQRRLPAGRKADLAAYVAEVGEVTVVELAEHFDVSTDTIRRDLDQLDTDGALIRTHGGAISIAASGRPDIVLDVRMRLKTRVKEQIAALAATLVVDDSSLMVNGGTTTLAFARALAAKRGLTVVTNNLRLPSEISPDAVRDLYLIGGAVRLGAQTTIGPVQFAVAERRTDLDVRCDLAIIGVGAVSADVGFTTSNLAEGAMMGEMIERADKVAVLADASKFGRRLFAQVVQLDAVDYLITDEAPPPDLAAALAEADVRVLTPTDARRREA